MSTNEKTSVVANTQDALDAKIAAYNAELAKESPNAVELAAIEKEAKEAAGKIATELMKETLNSFLKFENPMLEAARTLEIMVPYPKIEKDTETGAPSRMFRDEKSRTIDATSMTKLLGKYKVADGFVNSGVMTSGMSWTYKAEKFADLMTQRVGKKLEVDNNAQKSIAESYKLSDKAKTEGGTVKDPTSNKQMVAFLQEIIDACCFVDNGKGGNLLHANNKDVNFIDMKFTGKDSKNAAAIKVAAGKNIVTYIFQVIHMMVTGKSYQVTGFKQNDGSAAIVYQNWRDPLAVSALRNKPETKEQAA